jgi:hypothetical protein
MSTKCSTSEERFSEGAVSDVSTAYSYPSYNGRESERGAVAPFPYPDEEDEDQEDRESFGVDEEDWESFCDEKRTTWSVNSSKRQR